MRAAILMPLLFACSGGGGSKKNDVDGDGYKADEDCDDDDAEVNPGADEVCNDGIDNDCDGGPGDCLMEGSLSLADADTTLAGETVDSFTGYAVASAGDWNGDGLDDVLVGAYLDDADFADGGAAYVIPGPLREGNRDLITATAKFTGFNASDHAGVAVSPGGDLNGDGYGDIVIGADVQDTTSPAVGFFYTVLGPQTGTFSLLESQAIYYGVEGNAFVGTSIALVTDAAGGTHDLLIGADGSENGGTDSGMVFLIDGSYEGEVPMSAASAALVGEDSRDEAGGAVADGGDVDGDGTHDIVVGAYAQDEDGLFAGAAYVVYGPILGSGSLSGADTKLKGAGGDQAGIAVAGAGDADGDGLDDVLVGADQGTGGGPGYAAYFKGPVGDSVAMVAADALLSGASSGDRAGTAVAFADVDGDGNADVLVGVPGADQALLYYGPLEGSLSASEADLTLSSTATGEEAGCTVTGLGDTNGDGLTDLAIGACLHTSASVTRSGGVYVVLGLGM